MVGSLRETRPSCFAYNPTFDQSLTRQLPSAFAICDRVGRVWATRVLTSVWAIGIAIFMACGTKGNLGGVYAGRFVAGLGVGMTPVVGYVLPHHQILIHAC